MNPQKQELLEKLKGANNILVTVSSSPSVDQLAACIGMTLLLNKLKKHATAVFSGEVPSTIEFLKPEETIEKNTDSLRDFIISLDKSKADKLRYKVEDQMVRIFITPYRTSISENDLDFSQGDFNVDVVLCLGVNQQQDLDQAITSHGRILHDATVISIGTQGGAELGSVNWVEPTASSLSELVAGLADVLGKQLLDAQIATSLLTGIVAETDRFSNEKTSPETMRLSAELMAAGANQQLVANELETTPAPPREGDSHDQNDGTPTDAVAGKDGTLEITHTEGSEPAETTENFELPEPQEPLASLDGSLDTPDLPAATDLLPPTDDGPTLPPAAHDVDLPPEMPVAKPASRMVLQPPSLGGMLTANTTPELESLQDPLSTVDVAADNEPLLDHGIRGQAAAVPEETPLPEPITPEVKPLDEPPPADPLAGMQLPAAPEPPVPPASPAPLINDVTTADTTLTELETSLHSPHVQPPTASDNTASPAPVTEPAAAEPDLDAARDAVIEAINSALPSGPPSPTAASGAAGYLNVQDLPDINDDGSMTPLPAAPDLTEAAVAQPLVEPLPLPPPPADPLNLTPADEKGADGAPPPVPPPLPLDDLSKFTSSGQ